MARRGQTGSTFQNVGVKGVEEPKFKVHLGVDECYPPSPKCSPAAFRAAYCTCTCIYMIVTTSSTPSLTHPDCVYSCMTVATFWTSWETGIDSP